MESFMGDQAAGGDASAAEQNGEPFRLRSYQAEMVEESMHANIICVMDTGSGKTHIAIERTRAELEICEPHKLVWFLAPTVTLCEQQYEVFKSNMPGYGIQLLSGKDNVDHWTEQVVWDVVLNNVKIVLSTHQVLLDALTHAFVTMNRLALVIFDEAHHCTQNHPAHRIMSGFYTPRLGKACDQLPTILGLTASPIMKAKATSEDLQKIETNLCATARTPKLHRSELLRYVHKPHLARIQYPVEPVDGPQARILVALRQAFSSYDLAQDPYVLELAQQQGQGYDVSRQIQKTYVSGKTYCREQLKSLLAKVEATLQELGPSTMDWYLGQCLTQFEKMVHTSDSQLLDWSVNEKKHLLDILKDLSFPDNNLWAAAPLSLDGISKKTYLLVDLLASEAKDNPDFTCLVFIEQRIWVACVAEILTHHPRTKDLLRVGTFVGTSQNSKRKADIATLVEPRNQHTTLDDFRAGMLNVILATSVLEEGIDISSCHLVIDFERSKNLKSFVQRRGRARKKESKYVIFMPEEGDGRPPESWHSLEERMKAAYMDDLRQVKLAEERELQAEDGQRYLEVPSTGALLTLDNASQHLHHFCALLGSGPYIDTRPQFEFTETGSGLISARVMLPISVDPAVRFATSLESWATERLAKQDAAFQAYTALFRAGLINDNLLPARHEDEELSELQIPDYRPSLVEVSPTLDPWPLVAYYQQENPHVYYRTLLTLRSPNGAPTYMLLFTPTILPSIPEILLYWNESTRFQIDCSSLSETALANDEVADLKLVTYDILYSVFEGRMKTDRRDFLWLISPCTASGHFHNRKTLSERNHDSYPATELLAQGRDVFDWGLITRIGDNRRYMLKAIKSGNRLQLVRVPKRRDFLHPVLATSQSNDAYTKIEEVAAAECVVYGIPTTSSIFALLCPSILHRFEIGIIAEMLRTTILHRVLSEHTHLPLIIRAITSSATGEDDNYQRLEFLGDCILKLFATIHLMAANLHWPESYLTARKGKIVSNGFLARATLATGLESFIITKGFTGAKWAPRYAGDLLAERKEIPKVQKSSKLLADVIESLIGASYVIGALDKAFLCIQTLLPLEPWTPIIKANTTLYEAAPVEHRLADFGVLEMLIGHTFNKKMLLLEALTHGSFKGPNQECSYERLEFLGDAVLDYIISTRLYAHEPPLPHQQMHAIRTATVNASFLAFRMFETTVPEEMTNKTTMQTELQHRALWQFLRSGDPALNANRNAALRQHEHVKKQIIAGLNDDARYPWHLFALTDAPKFLSDIVESVIGAVYVDSRGDIPTCEKVVRRLGIIDCLEHILHNEIDCLHPKERLGHLAVEKNVKYARVEEDETIKTAAAKMYKCQVKVGGENVGGVVEGLKRLNAETIAAYRAVSILESQEDVIMGAASDDDEFFDADEDGGVILEDYQNG